MTALPQTQLPLTTWYGSGSAYKTLSVAPPRGVKAGDIWSLALFCPPSDVAASSPLDAIPPYKTALVSLSSVEDAGAWAPVPVMSEPIRFTAAIKGGLTAVPPVKGEKVKVKAAPTEKVAKQDRIQRAFVLPPRSLEESSSELLLTEQTSFDLDKVCSCHIDYLSQQTLTRSAFTSENLGLWPSRRRLHGLPPSLGRCSRSGRQISTRGRGASCAPTLSP